MYLGQKPSEDEARVMRLVVLLPNWESGLPGEKVLGRPFVAVLCKKWNNILKWSLKRYKDFE